MRIAYHEPDIRQMIATLRRSAKELRDTQNQMRGIAKMLKDGVLLGQGGESFGNALSNTLVGSIERLAQRLEERANFVERELEQHIAAEAKSRSQFK